MPVMVMVKLEPAEMPGPPVLAAQVAVPAPAAAATPAVSTPSPKSDLCRPVAASRRRRYERGCSSRESTIKKQGQPTSSLLI